MTPPTPPPVTDAAAWAVRPTVDQTGWWVVGPAGSPSVTVLPYSHFRHAPEAEDFAAARVVAQQIAQTLGGTEAVPFDWAAWQARRAALDAELEAIFRESDRLLASTEGQL